MYTDSMGLKMGAAQTRAVASGPQSSASEGDSSDVQPSSRGARRPMVAANEDEEKLAQTPVTSEDESRQRRRRLLRRSSGYASSPTVSAASRRLRQGHAGVCQSTAAGIDKPRRKIAPLLIVEEFESESARASSPPMQSPPPTAIDKPREERSFREFFPDLSPAAPLVIELSRRPASPPAMPSAAILNVAELDKRLADQSLEDQATRGFESLASYATSPLSEISSVVLSDAASGTRSAGVAERPSQSRASSSLSIRLIFNDPEVSRARTFPPSLRPLAGKSAHSYLGTPQSSVVVLAPKKPVLSLPETRFRRVDESAPLYSQKEFKRPESHYIRNIELTESDLASRVEYDLDEVDREWLKNINQERVSNGGGGGGGAGPEISPKVLEELIDCIEKTWFDLVKDVQKAISAIQQERLPPEESACAICGEEECDNTNAIVFCDGCNLAVHQDCYGVPYIPEGQWLCRKCMLSPDTAVSCLLCPQRSGAFKKTTTNKWAHLLCALWIPEVGISNTVYMEPIDSVDQIPRSRWKLYCNLCHRKVGACIQCSQRQCVTAFHATCARRARLSMTVRADRRTGETIFRAFCEKHTPASHTQKIDLSAPLKGLANRRKAGAGGTATPLALSLVSADLASLLLANGKAMADMALTAAVAGDISTPSNGHTSGGGGLWPGGAVGLLSHADAETADFFHRAASDSDDASLQLTMRIFNPDHPVLNEFAIAQILERAHLSRMSQQQRARVVARVGRFWALKRSVRHGAPLLKRLHLEPWTASVTKQRALEMAEEQRQAFIRRVRTDLERVRMLVESVRRREREKLRRARVQVEYLQRIVDPVTPLLTDIITELMDKRDPRGVFSRPVSEEEAADYRSVIDEPMDFGTVRRKVSEYQYGAGLGGGALDEFERDVRLVCTNCLAYNKPTTYFFQLATRMLRHIDRLVAVARTQIERLPIDPRTGRLLVDVDFDIFALCPPEKAAIVEVNEDQVVESNAKSECDAATIAKEDKEEASSAAAAVASPLTRSQRKHQEALSSATKTGEAATPSSASNKKRERKKILATPTRSGKAFRKLTLFEQMSLSPPDVRQREISQYLTCHPGSTRAPQSDIPDDVNVLKERLRRTSMASPPATASAKKNTPRQKGGGDGLALTPRKRGAGSSGKPKPASTPTSSKRAKIQSPSAASESVAATSSPVLQQHQGLLSGLAIPTAAALGEDPTQYAGGTLVWVKPKALPWVPAEIALPTDSRVPEAVQHDQAAAAVLGRTTLVRLFRGNKPERVYRWFNDRQICRLGVNQKLDEILFRGKTSRNHPEEIDNVRQAYREACRSKRVKPIISTTE
ncbi:hypothetical protein H4R26_000061 [Coemansia thaxteri]|uniref:Peregrin n=1 Tax=Coemansia thaxteri TaxID=2663907 RepID=A0A9W8BIY4_9FUNG|nr:hypothetical protein H4R26_000061 [Coemansia thaxteri]